MVVSEDAVGVLVVGGFVGHHGDGKAFRTYVGEVCVVWFAIYGVLCGGIGPRVGG